MLRSWGCRCAGAWGGGCWGRRCGRGLLLIQEDVELREGDLGRVHDGAASPSTYTSSIVADVPDSRR